MAIAVMNWNITVIGIVAGLTMMIVVLELVRRKVLGERYALLWLLLAALIILFGIWPGLLLRVADLLDIVYPPSIIFGLALLFIIAIMIHFSVVLSRQSKGYNKIIQRLSLLEEKISSLPEEQLEQGPCDDNTATDAGED